jgi:hypothetical protein
VRFVMGELSGGEENVGLRTDSSRVGAAEMLLRSLRCVLANGASSPVGMTVGGCYARIRESTAPSLGIRASRNGCATGCGFGMLGGHRIMLRSKSKITSTEEPE